MPAPYGVKRQFLIVLLRICAAAIAFPPLHAFAQSSEPPVINADAFGEEVMLTAKTIVSASGKATWDNAFPTLMGSFKSIAGVIANQKMQANGPVMVVYNAVDDRGFSYTAAVPVAAAASMPSTGGFSVGQSPAGKALKFVYRGSYEAMDIFYETITRYIDEKRIERQGQFIEEYVTDPLTTAEDKLVINVYVLVK